MTIDIDNKYRYRYNDLPGKNLQLMIVVKSVL